MWTPTPRSIGRAERNCPVRRHRLCPRPTRPDHEGATLADGPLDVCTWGGLLGGAGIETLNRMKEDIINGGRARAPSGVLQPPDGVATPTTRPIATPAASGPARA